MTNPNDHMRGLATEQQIREAICIPVRTIVTHDGWKFNSSPSGENELYCLEKDPLEISNLAKCEEGRSVVRELLTKLRRWQEEVDNKVALPGHP